MKTIFSLSLLLAIFFGNAAAFMTSPSKAAVKVDTSAEESSTSLAYGYGKYEHCKSTGIWILSPISTRADVLLLLSMYQVDTEDTAVTEAMVDTAATADTPLHTTMLATEVAMEDTEDMVAMVAMEDMVEDTELLPSTMTGMNAPVTPIPTSTLDTVEVTTDTAMEDTGHTPLDMAMEATVDTVAMEATVDTDVVATTTKPKQTVCITNDQSKL